MNTERSLPLSEIKFKSKKLKVASAFAAGATLISSLSACDSGSQETQADTDSLFSPNNTIQIDEAPKLTFSYNNGENASNVKVEEIDGVGYVTDRFGEKRPVPSIFICDNPNMLHAGPDAFEDNQVK